MVFALLAVAIALSVSGELMLKLGMNRYAATFGALDLSPATLIPTLFRVLQASSLKPVSAFRSRSSLRSDRSPRSGPPAFLDEKRARHPPLKGVRALEQP